MPSLYIPTTDAQISNAFLATLNAAPGATYLAQAKSLGVAAAAQVLINATGKTTAATLATQIATNLGLTGNAKTIAENYLVTQINAAGGTTKFGAGLVSALDLFAGLQSDATFGTAATTYVDKVNSAVTYSNVSTNTSTDLSVLAAAVSSTGATVGTTFTLTTSADEMSPTASGSSKTTSGDDTFNAGSGRLQSTDSINGGAGNDTLNITLVSGAAPIVQNVETINITLRYDGGAGATALDFSEMGVVGASAQVNVNGTTSGAFSNLGSAATIRANSGYGNNIALSLQDSTGTADSITVVGNNASSFTLNITGIETLNLNASGAMTLGTTANATQLGLGSAGVVNIGGAGNVTLYAGTAGNINTSWTDVSAINATALQGNLTVTLPIVNQIAINAGTGADVINLGSGLDTLDSIDGGAGSDTVRGQVVGASTIRPTLTNVETLTFDSVTTGTVDLRNASGVTTLNVVLANASATFNNLDKGLVNIDLKSGDNASDFSFNYANGPSDVTIALNTIGTATGGVTYGDITRTNNTGALTLNSLGMSGNTMSALTDNAAATVTINATQSLTMGDIAAAAANTVTLNATGTANLGIGSAAFASASTISIVATGTANVSATDLVVGDDITTINISAAQGDVSIGAGAVGDVGIASGLLFTTAATAVVAGVTVSIGSGATASITLGNASAGSAIDKLTFTLAGSGNVDIAVGSGGTAWARGTAQFDGVSLGGALTLNASAVTAGLAFNIDLGGSKAASGSVISLGALADTVYGGASADTIEGGGGNDELAGRGGADVFVYIGTGITAAGGGLAANGVDLITDFSTADIIRLGLTAVGALYSANSSLSAGLNTAGGASAQSAVGSAAYIAAFQRGSDVVIQVAMSTGTAMMGSANFLEIVLQGETYNTAYTAAVSGGFVQITNVTIS
jgi:hypothetical protein